jgi:glucose-6-phosphate isomerase
MKAINFQYKETSHVAANDVEALFKKLAPELEKVRDLTQTSIDAAYKTDYASLPVPADEAIIDSVKKVVTEKKDLKPTMLILIGIGGSNLGTLAIHEALSGNFYNEKNPEISFYSADTVDPDKLSDQLFLMEQELQKGKNVILNVVTKSGTTTETIANFELFLQLLKKYKPEDFHNYVVVTTDEGSKLAHFAQEKNFSLLTLPPQVGGRYSVFTAVGLFPLGLLGADIEQLCLGARMGVLNGAHDDLDNNLAAQSAIIKYALYKKGIAINDLFVFSTRLTSVALWYRQLMGESIGKEYNRDKKQVEVGITPTVSVGSTDLHSVGQLYLGGPRDKYTTFLTVDQYASNVSVPNMPEFEQFVPHIQGKPFATVMDAILEGVKQAYKEGERPYSVLSLPELDELSLGQLLQFYMVEMIYLGYLLKVNPFDQPNVESYKKETRRILAS